ncbi:MAG: DmsE family decaheme c-type cytochrome [Terriglobales bacterium]
MAFILLAMSVAAFAADNKHSEGDTSTPQTAPVLPAAGAKYVGSEQCKMCHADQARMMQSTPHYRLFGAAKPTGAEGCESCHGPGSAHIDGGGDQNKIFTFKDATRQETSARCLSCHGGGREQSHFVESAHSSSEVGCLDCHSPHHAKEKEHLLVQSSPQLCYGCHTSAKADFAKPFHHRVNEGLVECNDCHNPHGTGTIRQLRALPSGDAVCFKCHADKQGPFAYEHVPVKTEGCTACHTPHGSTNPRLLKVSQVNMLCLQCHTFPTVGPAGPAHNQSAKYQACTMCHNQIHGSNFSSVFFK